MAGRCDAMTILRVLLALVLWLPLAAARAEEQPDFFRIWTIEKPLCPGKCGKFTIDYVTRFVGKQIDVGRDWFTNDMFESCLRGAHYDDITQQDPAQFLDPVQGSSRPASASARRPCGPGASSATTAPIATFIYVNDKKMILVFEQGVFVPLK